LVSPFDKSNIKFQLKIYTAVACLQLLCFFVMPRRITSTTMTAQHPLRQSIAREAARMLLRNEQSSLKQARLLASRQLSRKRIAARDLPTQEEIQAKMYELAQMLTGTATAPVELWQVVRQLMLSLEGVSLDPERHPEGDALYHSLQVYQLGIDHLPYDEEFLLACLVHNAGLVLDRRNPQRALLQTLGPLITVRTRFLLEHRPAACDYLITGRLAKSIRQSEHFEELILLARCDREGRVPGREVPSLEAAMGYLQQLDSSWDNV